MTTPQHHIIRRQVVEIKIPDQAEAFALQQELSRLLKNKVAQQLEPTLNALTPNQQFLRLDKLEIDLGKIDPYQAPQQLVKKIVQGIEKAVKQQSTGLGSQSKNTSKEQPIFLSEKEAIKVQFLHFLETGLLPWWATPTEETVLLTTLEGLGNKFAQQLKHLLKQQPNALNRLVKQYSATIITQITQLLAANDWKLIKAWQPILITIAKQLGVANEQLWQANLQYLLNAGNIKEVAYLGYALKKINSSNSIVAIIKNIHQIPPAKVTKTQKKILEASLEITLPKQSTKSNNTKKEALKELLEEGIFIQNAGLIMLAPLIPSFFEQLGLLENKNFKDEASQERSVHLLQYLVTNETNTAEHELALNKILCGIPLEQPIAKYIELSDQEKTLANDLLVFVIKEWKALKNSSPATLHALFLQREGKLTYDEPNWTLRVEEQAMDVLLGKLPWGFSIVKLEWMDGMVFGEWGE